MRWARFDLMFFVIPLHSSSLLLIEAAFLQGCLRSMFCSVTLMSLVPAMRVTQLYMLWRIQGKIRYHPKCLKSSGKIMSESESVGSINSCVKFGLRFLI